MMRAAAFATALLVAAFFGLAVRQSTAVEAATQRIDGLRNDTRTAALIDRAGQLNPDSEVDILRARLAVAHGQLARARRILLAVVRREPDNVTAWRFIQFAISPIDPALGRRARREFDRLVPRVPDP